MGIADSSHKSIDGRSKKTAFAVLLLTVVSNAIGQIFFKAAHSGNIDEPLLSLFTHYETWVGLLFYGLSAICWLWVLSRVQLSYAYPILALSYPIVVALSAILFSETVTVLHWIGVIGIVLGVSLLSKT
jgi:drug/metabolite transporter (DMT)-like permease